VIGRIETGQELPTMKFLEAAVIAAFAVAASAGAAAAQTGPVAEACKEDIAKFCADKKHDGEVRACLEAVKDKVSPACKAALETTGGGMGKKRKMNQGY
jgi:hypothetical protein